MTKMWLLVAERFGEPRRLWKTLFRRKYVVANHMYNPTKHFGINIIGVR